MLSTSVIVYQNFEIGMMSTFERKLSLCNIRLGGLLMGVCTITQSGPLNRASQLLLGQLGRGILLSEVPADGIIVFSSHFECLQSQFGSGSLSNFALSILPSFEKLLIISRIRKDRNALVVFGSST